MSPLNAGEGRTLENCPIDAAVRGADHVSRAGEGRDEGARRRGPVSGGGVAPDVRARAPKRGSGWVPPGDGCDASGGSLVRGDGRPEARVLRFASGVSRRKASRGVDGKEGGKNYNFVVKLGCLDARRGFRIRSGFGVIKVPLPAWGTASAWPR